VANFPHNPSPYAYPPHVPDEPTRAEDFDPDVAGSRLVSVAQWVALAGAIVTVAAGIIAASAVASSRDWGEQKPLDTRGMETQAQGGGALIIIGGLVVAVFLAIAIYTIARGLYAHPHGGGLALFVVAGLLAAAGLVLLVTPGVVLGDAGSAAARTASSGLSDAGFAGLAFLLAAVLAATAGALALVAVRRCRRAAAQAGAGGSAGA
jgi:hypothetical protein